MPPPPQQQQRTFKRPEQQSPHHQQQQQQQQSTPVLIARDRGRADVLEFNLAGERIAGFLVGGEPRLCLPQVSSSPTSKFLW